MKNWSLKFQKEQFESQTNGVISDSIIQNWTPTALECYKLNCDCKKCPIKQANYSFKCKMNKVVEALIKTQGLPDENLICELEITGAA